MSVITRIDLKTGKRTEYIDGQEVPEGTISERFATQFAEKFFNVLKRTGALDKMLAELEQQANHGNSRTV